jgi:hypothetical protein
MNDNTTQGPLTYVPWHNVDGGVVNWNWFAVSEKWWQQTGSNLVHESSTVLIQDYNWQWSWLYNPKTINIFTKKMQPKINTKLQFLILFL